MRSWLLKIIFFSLLVLSSACGYRFGAVGAIQDYKSIYVPYVEGDEKGIVTNSLIYALSARSGLAYTNCDPDLILEVCLRPPQESTIGYLYASGNESKVITSNEARLALVADVKVKASATGRLLYSCQVVSAAVEFDFQSDFSHQGEDTFSLGQLKMHGQARETSFAALSQKIAEKIVDSLLYCW